MRLSIIITIIVSIILTSCSDDGAKTISSENNQLQQGDLGQDCYPNNTCNDPYSCEEGTCINPAAQQCGNNIVEPGEQCDGTNMGANTCEGVGYDAGDLSCNADCTVSDLTCRTYECGNDLLDPGEECDGGTNLSCLDYGFSQEGVVTCGDNCVADTSQCPTECWDGIISGDEACDAINESTYMYPPGTPTCEEHCAQQGRTPGSGARLICDMCHTISYELCNCRL